MNRWAKPGSIIAAFRKWEDTTVGSEKKLNLFGCGNVTGRHL
jgi:hypothetical protein